MPGEYKISLQDRFFDAFGLVVRNTLPRVAEVGIGLGGSIYAGDLVEAFEEPLLDLITMRVSTSSDREEAQTLEQEFDIPSIIRFSREKIINETILNRDFVEGIEPGMVVESSGWMPWDISVQGLLINQDNHLEPPFNQMDNFVNFLSYHRIYDIISNLTNSIDVSRVTVRNKSFNQLANWPDTISYTLNLKSHESPEALILN